MQEADFATPVGGAHYHDYPGVFSTDEYPPPYTWGVVF